MFNSIKTSEQNKIVVSTLTTRLGLGAENVIARLAIGHSLSTESELLLDAVQDSKGKEYSTKVLLGEYKDIFIGLICEKYKIHKSNNEISRYLKLHLDDGLEKIFHDMENNPNLEGVDLLIRYIKAGLNTNH